METNRILCMVVQAVTLLAEKPAGKAKAGAKCKDDKTIGAAANAVAGGDYGSSKTWQPKNTFEEAAGDVEEE